MPCWPMGLPRRRLKSICTVGKHKKKWLSLEQITFPYTKRLYLSPTGMWVIWLWEMKRNLKKEANKSHE